MAMEQPEYILRGIEDFLDAHLVYFSMIQQEGEKLYICFGKRAFFIVDFDPPKREKYYYAWVQRVVMDLEDPMLFVIYFEAEQNQEPLYLRSASRDHVLEEMRICWRSEFMFRKWQTDIFPLKYGVTPGRGKVIEEKNFTAPLDKCTKHEQQNHFFFLPDAFTLAKEQSERGPVHYNTAAGDGEGIWVQTFPPRPMSLVGARGKDAVRLLAESEVWRVGSVDEDQRMLASHPLEKRANLTGDVAGYVAWLAHARTNVREVAVLVVRRIFIPPLGTHFQDTVLSYQGVPERVEDDQAAFEAKFQTFVDSISPVTTVRFFDDTVATVRMSSLLVDEESMAWFLGHGFVPNCHHAARALAKSVAHLLQSEGPEICDEVVEEVDAEIMLLEDGWDIIQEAEEDAPGLTSHSHELHWESWRQRLSRFFAFCIDGGLGAGQISIAQLAKVAQLQESISANGPDEANRLIEYFLYLKKRGGVFLRDIPFLDKVKDPDVMADYTINERVVASLLDTGYFEYFLDESPPRMFLPFLLQFLEREATTVDLLLAICAKIAVMSADPALRAELVLQGTVARLVGLLRCVYEPLLLIVVKCAVNLIADNVLAKTEFVKNSGVRLLIPHLQSRNVDLERSLCVLLKNLASNDDLRAAVRDEGPIPALVSKLEPSKVPGIRVPDSLVSAATSALWNLCSDSEARDIATGCGVVRITAEAYRTTKSEDVKARMGALIMVLMVKHDKNRLQFAEEDLIAQCTNVLAHSRNPDVVRSALGCLSVLATVPELAEAIKKENCEAYLGHVNKVFERAKGGEKVLTFAETLAGLLA